MLGEWGALAKLVERLEQVLTPPIDGVSGEFYAWHPYPLGQFLEGMTDAQRYLAGRDEWSAGATFIDVGCGIGTKMAIASFMGWRVKGLELYPEYAEVARRLMPSAPIMIAEAGAWTDYGADLVYSYRLCTDEDDQRQLTAHIVSCMRPGSLLFLVGCPPPEGCELLRGSLWRVP